MSIVRAGLLLGAALLPFSLQAQTAPLAASATAVAPIAYTERTLPNGLRVYAIRDTATANVSVQVWYAVGSKDDPKDRSGFAHMFEHLMFKATRNLVPEQMDRLTEDVGGFNNASTNDDYTNYYEVVPANHLQRLLFAEADRMGSLVVDPASFASERDVVKEELRSRVLAQPYGKLFSLYFPEVSYTRHPYGRPTIGSIEDLDAATIDDIRAFHATYYRPDNAVLVVAGNFDPAQLNRWVDQYFGPIARPVRPIPRVQVAEPPRTAPIRRTVYEPNAPLPAVLLSYPTPPDDSPDSPALSVLNAVLARGESSRLYQSLVYRDRIAQSADTYLDSKKDLGAFAIYAILASGKTADQGEAAIKREIAALRDTPVSEAELAEAKNQILTSVLMSRETAEGKAFTLAQSVLVDGDPQAADRQLAAIGKVTAADVQRAARTYLADNRAAVIRYLPTDSAKAPKGDTIAVPATLVTTPLVVPPGIPVQTPAPEGQRMAPPPGTPVAAALPAPVESRLANGMRLILVERHGLPLVTASVSVAGGATRNPKGRGGLAGLTATLLTRGTTSRSASAIARDMEALGGSIQSGTDSDGAQASLTVMSGEIDPALAILADVVRNPAFAPDEIERARAQDVDALAIDLKDPSALAGRTAMRAAFGATSYGNISTLESLHAITRDDILRAYREAWRPEQATLVLVGDIGADQARALAEKLFGSWKAEGAAPAPVAPPADFPAPRVVVVDLPGAGQAGVVVARPGIARADKLFYPAQLANATLGVGFSSRLNQEIRIKRGLAYGAGSALDARKDSGVVSASTQTKNPTAPEVVRLIVAEMKRLGSEPVPAAELETRKAVLIGDFGRDTETNAGIAGILGEYAVTGVPLDELKRFVPAIQGVDTAAVEAAARAVLDPAGATIVVVGDARLFADELRKTYPALEVIPAAALNLNVAGLK